MQRSLFFLFQILVLRNRLFMSQKKKNSQATLFMQIDVIDQKDNGGVVDLFWSDKESFNAIQSLS